MKINTIRFGEMEINNNHVITFENGLPGFENLKKYVMIKDSEQANSFSWLQSTESAETALPIVNPFDVKNDYDFEIDTNTVSSLDIKQPNDVAVYSVAVIPDKITKMTVNLKAPIIINTTNNMAKQMILNNANYSTKHLILDEILESTFTQAAAAIANTESK